MSAFDLVPDEFPFEADLSRWPAQFALRGDTADRIVVILLSIFWIGFGGVMFLLLGLWIATQFPALDVHRTAFAILFSVASCAALLRFWLWGAIADRFRTLSVSISETDIEACNGGLLGSTSWTCPIADYRGITLVNLGTHDVGGRKIPLRAIHLVHSDASRSIPFAVNEAGKIGRKTLERFSSSLKLPIVEDAATEAHPPGTILVNRYQAMKVRMLYWGFVAAFALFAGGSVYQWLATTIDVAWPILALIFAATAGAMHVYLKRYIIFMRDDGEAILFRTASLGFNSHRISYPDILALRHREGKSYAAAPRGIVVHAPWLRLDVNGYRFPFIIDMQADFVDERLLQAVARRGHEA